MKKIFTVLCVLAAAPAMANVKDIIFVCKSKNPSQSSFQFMGDLGDGVIRAGKFVEIDVWNEDRKPLVLKNQTWTADATYRPRSDKYKNSHRYLIQKNTPNGYGFEVIMPSKATVYELAKKESIERGDDMVQASFEAVLRYRDDFGDDTGGQEYLECGTGWIHF